LMSMLIWYRYYTVQYAVNSGAWQTVPERVDPQVTSYTVADLKPFTAYRFRIQATNDIGPSGWSVQSDVAQTLPAGMGLVLLSVRQLW
jgi:protein sidekick